MHRPHSPEAGMSLQGTNATRLYGEWLRAARMLWIALTILAAMLFVAGTVVSSTEQLPRCTAAGVACDPVELAAEDVAVMQQLGVPAGAVIALLVVLDSVLNITFLAVGVTIFWRRADDWMAMLLSLTLVLLGMVVFTSSGNALMRASPPLSVIVTTLALSLWPRWWSCCLCFRMAVSCRGGYGSWWFPAWHCCWICTRGRATCLPSCWFPG